MPELDDVLLRLKQLHPKLIDLSLDRIVGLLEKLGSPHTKLSPVVHIAGTNGKGSVTAMLRTMLEASGRRVHVYTSPHLVRFNERIAIATPHEDGWRAKPIPEAALVDLLQRVEQANAGDPMTFFEITTAAAFLAFAEAPADVVLLEVGLGGRLDASNVVAQPKLTVITPVSMDHADKLGDTVARIAGEKAGILKRNVVGIIARQDDEALPVIQNTARRVGAPLKMWGQDFESFEQNGRMIFQSQARLLDLPLPALIGTHQIDNAGVAVAAALELGLDEAAIAKGLRAVEWPARMQRLSSGPLAQLLPPGSELWLDGGHNPAGAAALADTLAVLEDRNPKPLVLVCGMMGQKDARGFFSSFTGLAREIVCVPIPGAHEQPHVPDALAAIAREMGFKASVAVDVPAAVRQVASPDETRRIVICGSLYLAGHVLAYQTGTRVQSN
jgi:dihydrofolate synthase / folylpolyglutamate synthase